ncbi:hypothetical protein GQ55_4G366300 [Panicum hallii var. hallii]|uniref:Serine-threonine/tyrosine-protein kinase catalytic domain-containing protein n=1 Tax=Panicum hallii var. hallii TaxID=1504633 RepID=A0A2T7E3Y7_9POAL|nr:hypothetical protein GQ55_4G366300 [Panicum hallii var. hallii]
MLGEAEPKSPELLPAPALHAYVTPICKKEKTPSCPVSPLSPSLPLCFSPSDLSHAGQRGARLAGQTRVGEELHLQLRRRAAGAADGAAHVGRGARVDDGSDTGGLGEAAARGVPLGDWAKPQLMDTKLGRQYPKKQVQEVAALALRCLWDDPKNRPGMADGVLLELERLQQNGWRKWQRRPARGESDGRGQVRTTAWSHGRLGLAPLLSAPFPSLSPFSLLPARAEPSSLRRRPQFAGHTPSFSNSLVQWSCMALHEPTQL